ncbi:hypothetical protein PTI98_000298 [Pleurotus ostreatus]|nr:hypothetical protein PTI98_000298 [Pleurotus ostreatus]
MRSLFLAPRWTLSQSFRALHTNEPPFHSGLVTFKFALSSIMVTVFIPSLSDHPMARLDLKGPLQKTLSFWVSPHNRLCYVGRASPRRPFQRSSRHQPSRQWSRDQTQIHSMLTHPCRVDCPCQAPYSFSDDSQRYERGRV